MRMQARSLWDLRGNHKFSKMLPLFSLAMWIFFALAPATLTFLTLLQIPVQERSSVINIGPVPIVLSEDRLLRMSFHRSSEAAAAITALNLPGIFVEMLIDIPLTWPDSWYPSIFFTLDDWRVFAFPWFCAPFWWLAGRGVDGLLLSQRMRWIERFLGSLLGMFFTFLLVGHYFISSPSRHGDDVGWYLAGEIFWAILLVPFPLSWIWKRKSRVVVDEGEFA